MDFARWKAAGNVPCEDCREVYDGQPPCKDCNKPDDLTEYNEELWQLWEMLSLNDRNFTSFGDVLHIPTEAIGNICSIYGLHLEDFESIVVIEQIMFPYVKKQYDNSK